MPTMVAAMQGCDMLLSDSGGVQEEAPALGVPLLVLREKTERPEGVASGNMVLVGTDKRRIVESVVRLLDPAVLAAMSAAAPFRSATAARRRGSRRISWTSWKPMRGRSTVLAAPD